MEKIQIRRLIYLIILLSAIIIIHCASNNVPNYIDENFSSKIVNDIVVLPVLDLRVEQEPAIGKIDKLVHRGIKRHLAYKNYSFSIVQDRSVIKDFAEFTEEEINEANPEWIKKLGPSDAKLVLLPVMLDLSSKYTFGSTCNVEMSAAIYDKTLGQCIWRDKGIGKIGQGGLMGVVLKPTMVDEGVVSASFNCTRSIPKNTN